MFAITAVAAGVSMKEDLFHVVFMVSLFSVAIQGTLLPGIAKKLDMVDDTADVRRTFNDYQEETALQLITIHIPAHHGWANRMIKDITMPTGALSLMIKRGEETIITKGDTLVLPGDNVILSVPPYVPAEDEQLEERYISKKDVWCNKKISELGLGENELIAMIIRGDESIIPDGKTIICEKDVVVLYK